MGPGIYWNDSGTDHPYGYHFRYQCLSVLQDKIWAIYSINEEAAKLVGINVDKIKILVFVLSGVFCAIAGIILASRSEAAIPTAGNAYEMDAIAATVIGGTSMSGGKGNMFGTALGAIKNGLSLLNVNTFWHQVVIGLFILFAVALDGFAAKKVN